MSRIGKQLIKIPAEVSIQLTEESISVKGPKGEMKRVLPSCLTLVQNSNHSLQVLRKNDGRKARQMHGLFRSLVSNMILGTSTGFTKIVELKGVGYRANMEKKILKLSLGFSHLVMLEVPFDIELSIENSTFIKISGIDKEKVGLMAQQLRSFKPPEPYKGKGILYKGEVIQRKIGKSSK